MERRLPILVAGAINTDLVATMSAAPAPGETITGTSFEIHGGGKAANQAVAAARYGASVAMIGSIGSDHFGKERLVDLRSEGIDIAWVRQRSDLRSGVALIFVDDLGENRIVYVPGATTTVDVTTCLEAIEAVGPSILLATNELPLVCLKALFSSARARGVHSILNAAPNPIDTRDLMPSVDVLVLNAGEAKQLLVTREDLDPPEAIERLRSLGPETVLLTLGARGVIGNDGDRLIAHRPPEVKARDTTGAGDTFCGVFAAVFAEGAGIAEAAFEAVRASALSVTKSGAQSSIPTRDEVDRAFGQR